MTICFSQIAFSLDVKAELSTLRAQIKQAQSNQEATQTLRAKFEELEKAAFAEDKETAADARLSILTLIDATEALPQMKQLVEEIDAKYPEKKRQRGVAHWTYALRLRFIRDFTQSTEHCTKAIELFKGNTDRLIPSTYITIANNYWKEGRIEDAARLTTEFAEKYKAVNPRSCAESLGLLASYYKNLGRKDDEYRTNLQLVEAFPTDPAATTAAAMVVETLMATGENRRALAIAENAILQGAQTPEKCLALLGVYADALASDKDYSRAVYISAVHFAMARNTSNDEIRISIDLMNRCVLKADGNLTRLVKYLEFQKAGCIEADSKTQVEGGAKNPLLAVIKSVQKEKIPAVFQTELEQFRITAKNSRAHAFLLLVSGRPLDALKVFCDIRNDLLTKPSPKGVELAAALGDILNIVCMLESSEQTYKKCLDELTSNEAPTDPKGSMLQNIIARYGANR